MLLRYGRNRKSFFIGLLLMNLSLLSLAPPANAQSEGAYRKLREQMVEKYLVTGGITDKRVLDAMKTTPRHEFVAPKQRQLAYQDMSLPIGDQQTISSPLIVSYMTQALATKAEDKVLEIGTGSGYQAAILSPLVAEVYSIEIVEPLGKKAEKLLKRLGYENVHVRIGDGYKGWPEHAPFDKIIVTCSPENVPTPLAEQLSEGGLMVIPVGERYQQTLYLFKKKDGKLESEALIPTLFVPMTGAAEDKRQIKPDPERPTLANGSFEEETIGEMGQPGWYYERNLERIGPTKDAPDGRHYIQFESSEVGALSHLLQGFPIDGRKVRRLKLSASVMAKDVSYGKSRDQQPAVIVSFYDQNRKDLGAVVMGPFQETDGWEDAKRTMDVPPSAREGIIRIGLFGATGKFSVDHVEIEGSSR